MIVRRPLKARTSGDGLQPLRDLDQVRSYLSGLGPTALFDLPWMPFYLAICFLFHPLIGLTALRRVACAGDARPAHRRADRAPRPGTRPRMARRATPSPTRAGATPRRSTPWAWPGRLAAVWGEANAKYLASQRRAADVAGGLGSISKVLRMMLQSAVLGLGGLSRDHAGGHRRHHHRGLDPRLAGAGAGGACHRQLEGLCRGPPGLDTAEAARRTISATAAADPVACAAQMSSRWRA